MITNVLRPHDRFQKQRRSRKTTPNTDLCIASTIVESTHQFSNDLHGRAIRKIPLLIRKRNIPFKLIFAPTEWKNFEKWRNILRSDDTTINLLESKSRVHSYS